MIAQKKAILITSNIPKIESGYGPNEYVLLYFI